MADNPRVKPWPGKCVVAPWPDNDTLRLTDNELALHDSVATEVNRIAGTEVDLFEQDTEGGVYDPQYGEPVDRAFKGPFRLKAYVEWADSSPEVREEGFRTSFGSRCWIARKDLEERGIPIPTEGDVVRFWNRPFFNDFSVDSDPRPPDAGYFFNVIDVDEDGHLFDNPGFVGFWLVLQRRTEFTPERRVGA